MSIVTKCAALAVGATVILGGFGCSDSSRTGPQSTAEPKIDVQLKPVTYAGFEEALRDLKGKVVVVDFWADFCVPCKMAMPHLVELHKKYAKDGLAVITVNIDDPSDTAARQKALKFLQGINAPFTNLGQDTKDAEVWQKELIFQYIPHAYVYNRKGERVKEFSGGQHQQIEKLVAELLKEN